MTAHNVSPARRTHVIRLRHVLFVAAAGAAALALVVGGCPTAQTTTSDGLNDTQKQEVQTIVQTDLATAGSIPWASLKDVPADVDTTYTAGDGLALSTDNKFSIKAQGVTLTMLATDVTGLQGLQNEAVTTAKLANGAVTIAKLAAEVFQNLGASLLDGSIDGSKLKDGSVTSAKLASVDGAKLDAATVTGDKLIANTIGSRELNASIDLFDQSPPIGGHLTLHSSANKLVAEILTDRNGVTGPGGGIIMYSSTGNEAGRQNAYMYGDMGDGSAEIGVADQNGLMTARLSGSLSRIQSGIGAAVQVRDGALNERGRLAAETGGGFLRLTNDSNQPTIILHGDIGDACFKGTVTPNSLACADLAEVFEHSDAAGVQPGVVMVIDPANPGHLTISTQAYDKRVAGIISGAGGLRPGVKISQAADGRVDLPLALAGRVYCYVDATENAVEIGDLLTTSDTPGYAMKAADREQAFGAVLGKAMEPLPRGEKGLILVLVALQ